MQVFVGWLGIPLLGLVALVLYRQKIVLRTIKGGEKIVLVARNGFNDVKDCKVSVLLTADSKPRNFSCKPSMAVDAVTGVFLQWEKKSFRKSESWKIGFENNAGFASQPVFSCANAKAPVEYEFENRLKK